MDQRRENLFFTGQSQPPNAPTMRLQNSGDEIFIYIKIANPASMRDLFMWCKRLRESGWFTKYRNLSSQAKDHPTILKIIFDFTAQKIALTIMMITFDCNTHPSKDHVDKLLVVHTSISIDISLSDELLIQHSL